MQPKKLNILYFIGAGASASIARLKVPLMNDFFRKAIQRFNQDGTSPDYWLAFATIEKADCFPPNSALKKLASKIRDANGTDHAANEEYKKIFLSDPERVNANLEVVFSNLFKGIDRFENEDAYGRLLFLLNRFFYDLDRELDGDDFNKAGHHSLAGMISTSENEHTFVSFNYDIWLERAFSKKGIWHPKDGYGSRPFEYYLPPKNTTPVGDGLGAGLYELFRFSDTAIRSKTLILKPHGSFSWMGGENFEALLIENEKKEGNISYNKDGVFYYNHINVPKSPGMNFRTLIVPPKLYKERKDWPPILCYVENDIKAILRKADMIVVIGWSMPNTDQDIRDIVSETLQQRKNQICRLIVCDVKQSSNDHVQKLKSLFRPSTCPIVHDKGFGPEFVEEVLQKHVG